MPVITGIAHFLNLPAIFFVSFFIGIGKIQLVHTVVAVKNLSQTSGWIRRHLYRFAIFLTQFRTFYYLIERTFSVKSVYCL